jgi:molybdenum cofactor cytidylyltransferase
MKFGETATNEAAGAILAHSVRVAGRALKKGRVLDADDVADLLAGGYDQVVAARLEPGDVHENDAAERIASALTGGLGVRANAPFTGRVNLYAQSQGVLHVDTDVIAELNAADEAITLATLAPWSWVRDRQLLGTVKIIPFAAPADRVERAYRLGLKSPLRVQPPMVTRIGLIQTTLPDTRVSVLDKTTKVLVDRIRGVGAQLSREDRCAHRAADIGDTVREQLNSGCEIVLVAGASAIVDRRDVVPGGIEKAGGSIVHFGMPVDPGNLVLIAEVEGRPVVGLPGCARSPAFNGFDWVLQRMAAGITVDAPALTGMGAGGLLKEGSARPLPRERRPQTPTAAAPKAAAVVLAAGQSRRMGEQNKLTAELAGAAMVRRSVEAIVQSDASPVVVVTGFEPEKVQQALAGMDVRYAHNPRYADGLSTSLGAGLDAIEGELDAVVVCLADMPLIQPDVINRLLAAYDPLEGREICVPTWSGKRGNPVLFDKRFFVEMRAVKGDVGARHLLGENEDSICEVPVQAHAVLEDVDSPADLARMRELFEEAADR